MLGYVVIGVIVSWFALGIFFSRKIGQEYPYLRRCEEARVGILQAVIIFWGPFAYFEWQSEKKYAAKIMKGRAEEFLEQQRSLSSIKIK